MRKYICYDCETSGLTPEHHSLLTVCFKVTDASLQQVETLSLKLKPNDGIYHVHPQALAINNINLPEHDKEAMTYKEARPKLLTFLTRHSNIGSEKLTPIGYNIAFDDAFLQHHLLTRDEWQSHVEYRKLDVAVAFELLKYFGVIPGSAKGGLSNVAKMFGHNADGAHNADVDVDLTLAILKSMKQAHRVNK